MCGHMKETTQISLKDQSAKMPFPFGQWYLFETGGMTIQIISGVKQTTHVLIGRVATEAHVKMPAQKQLKQQ